MSAKWFSMGAALLVNSAILQATAQATPVYNELYERYDYTSGDTILYDAGTGVPLWFQYEGILTSYESCQELCNADDECMGVDVFVDDGYCYTIYMEQNAAQTRDDYASYTTDANESTSWRYSDVCNLIFGDELQPNGSCTCGSGRVSTGDSRQCNFAASGLARRSPRTKRTVAFDGVPW